MAGRIRTIKPELLEDAKTAKLSHEAWRLFVSSILLADDYGAFRAEPGFLRGTVFWGSEADVHQAISEIVTVGLWRPNRGGFLRRFSGDSP